MKKNKTPSDQHPESDTLMDLVRKSGIPISSVLLYQAIDGASELSVKSSHPNRRAEMYYTPIGLVAIKKDETVIIPLATVAYARVLKSEVLKSE